MAHRRFFEALLVVLLIAVAVPSFAQQTGALHGRVTASDGSALPGVTIEARSNVLPQPRVTTTDGNGDFRLPALPPGNYSLTYSLSGMETATRNAVVLLNQDTPADAKLGVAGVAESITVTAEATLLNKESTALQTGFDSQQIAELPLTQDYRDLQKLVPGVMYTQDEVRGPSAGGSGQDNVYLFDGANITMPLFGVLNADPNTHDIAQVNIVRGGAKAVDFNRAAGFQIDTVSKSGTNKFAGEASYQLMNKDFIADQSGPQSLTFQQDRTWWNANVGGPIMSDRLFFYGSYYRPEFTRSNQANLYGPLPEYNKTRNDEFGKLTYTPTQNWLLNGSYRHSRTDETAASFTAFQAPTTGTGSETSQKLAMLETSWIINPNSFATLKVYDWRNPGGGSSDFTANVTANPTLGAHLDIANLGEQGRLVVPTPIGSNDAQKAFVQPFINQYGYICPDNASQLGLSCTPGQRTGGGTVGFGEFARDDDSFFRKSGQVGYNLTLGTGITHDLHIGYQHYKDSEDRFQTSNGWGSITIPAGVGDAGTCPARVCGTDTPAFFVASVSQQGAAGVPTIHSEVVSQNIELNDTIHLSNWTFNVGVLASQDTLYGQGLARANNYAGFTKSPGTKYMMHRFGFSDMIQPRLGATWAYDTNGTVWVSAAKYNSPANSDARAASWDRSLVANLNVYFDANGDVIGIQPNASSYGKWWQKGIKHPEVNEYMIGTSRQMTNAWSSRVYTRYRKGTHFIEDTNNTAREDYNAPAGIPRTPFVPDLDQIVDAIGSGSSYVIANLDGAFTKYYEATLESEYRHGNGTVGGSYTWSHYYGNFDQDNATFNSNNDQSTFIGSSNIADGAGRQLWNLKYGDLRGDRRNVVKVNGTYNLPWRASAGAFLLYQSGQPYQLESVLPYRALTGSRLDTNRYAEPAGSRRSPSHHQLDLNYTQNIGVTHGLNFQLAFDVFNVYDKQTGYNYETRIGTLKFVNVKQNPDAKVVSIPGSISDAVLAHQLMPGHEADFNRADWAINSPYAKTFYAPRRFQITARIQF